MADRKVYKTLASSSEGEYKEKGSKFLSYAFPVQSVEDFQAQLKMMKELHDASNFCYAYRIGLNGETYRAYDDNEPSGSAGMPIYNQLRSFEITNVGVIVARYYGGSKLGIPGLIHAFKESTNDALDQNEIIEEEVQVVFELQFTYAQMNDVMILIKRNKAKVIQQNFDNDCLLKASLPESIYSDIVGIIENMQGVQLKSV